MTIAIGLHVGDGMLLAADRQVTANYAKINQGKISLCLDPDPDPDRDGINRGTMAIAGAGDAHYINALSLLFQKPFCKPLPLSMDELENEFEKLLISFYRKHVIPFGKFRLEDCPQVQLIVAAHRATEKRMWKTQASTIIPVSTPVAVGCGGIEADYLFRSGYRPVNADMVAAQILAAYIVFRVKQVVDGCGHDTDFEIVGGRPEQFDHSGVRELEELFRRYTRMESHSSFHEIFGTGPSEHGPLTGDADQLQKDAAYLMQEHRRAGFIPELLAAQRRSRRVPLDQLPSRG